MTSNSDAKAGLAALAEELVAAAQACSEVGRDDEARKLSRAARHLAILALLSDNHLKIAPKWS